MLTKEDLKAIDELITKRVDERLREFEIRIEDKFDKKLNAIYEMLSDRIDRLEERFAEKFTEIEVRLARLEQG